MGGHRRLLECIVVLSFALMGLASTIPVRANATVIAAPSRNEGLVGATRPAGTVGRLAPGQLVRFAPSMRARTPVAASRPGFRTADDATFARQKHLSNSNTDAGRQSLDVRTLGLTRTVRQLGETVQASFSGMSYAQQTSQPFGADQGVWPPDAQIAVGVPVNAVPALIVEIVNGSGSIWTKTGQLFAPASDLNAFFLPPADATTFSISDPRIFFDAASGIWFSSAMAFDASNDGRVYLNVSLSSDPTLDWNQYTIESDNSGIRFDQVRLGINQDKIVLTWDDYSTSGFTGSETWVLDKGQIISGSSQPDFWQMGPDPSRFAVIPSTTLSASPIEYLIYNNADSNLSSYLGSPTLGVVALSGSPAQNNVTWSETAAPVPGGAVTVVPPDARQPSPGPPIATNDDRLLTATWQNGTLWAGGNDACTPTTDLAIRSCLRLFQLTTAGATPQIQQSFDVSSFGTDLYFPAAALDGQGNVLLGFSGSSDVLDPSFLTTVISAAGQPANVGSITNLASGVGPSNNCAPACAASPSNNRWGDYGAAVVDPLDPGIVWIAGEYSASATNPFDWGTNLSEVSVGDWPTPTPSPIVSVTPSPTQPSTVPDTATATATSVGTGPLPTPTSSATPSPVWLAVPVGQATAVSTIAGSLPVTISIPAGDTIAKIAVSFPDSVVPITPDDPFSQPVTGVAIVVKALDASGNQIAILDNPIGIAITFRPQPGDVINPAFAEIYVVEEGAWKPLVTGISTPDHGFYVATTSTDHLSSFALFAPPAGIRRAQSYLPLVEQDFADSGW